MNEILNKKCIICHQTKSVVQFSLRKDSGKRRPACTLCRSKQWRNSKGGKKWANRAETRKMKAKLARMWRWNLKCVVFDGYGNKCACCKIRIKEFLTLDHVKGNGNKERLERDQYAIYRRVLELGFPKTYRVLCIGCNWAIGNWGKCPHKGPIKH